jgi:hypothetical protein
MTILIFYFCDGVGVGVGGGCRAVGVGDVSNDDVGSGA